MDTLIPVYDSTFDDKYTVTEDYNTPNGMTMDGEIVPYSAKLVHFRKRVAWYDAQNNKVVQYVVNLEKKIISVVSIMIEYETEDGILLFNNATADNARYKLLPDRRGISIALSAEDENEGEYKLFVCMTLLVEETIREGSRA